MEKIYCYEIFEKAVTGKTDGNPFKDYEIHGTFKNSKEEKRVEGFYDGEGRYVVRFMPSYEGVYSFIIEGSAIFGNVKGSFEVCPARKGVHGPVRVADTYHFAYADGEPYYCVGTTCYVWELQNDRLIDETLRYLKKAGFNKIRFCIFPKHYAYNLTDPRSFPYEGHPMDASVLNTDNIWSYTSKVGDAQGNSWNFGVFNPEHFRHIEKCIGRLAKIGVEADIIVFHPYDRWGFSTMTREEDTLYIRYLIRRLAAFRNVWWAMANEYDLIRSKTNEDWKYYGELFRAEDPYGHLRSIHQCVTLYDHGEDWVTHVSFQRRSIYLTAEETDGLRESYHKPVVLDEIAYEGNIQYGWGNITAQELVRRFWEGALRGGYPGHGETYLASDNILWWSHGGRLKGESWKRVKFLLNILKETPGNGLRYADSWDMTVAVPENKELAASTGYEIQYYSFMQPAFREFDRDPAIEYEVEVIDTWNMKIKKAGTYSGKFTVELPGKQFMAIRLRKVK